MRLPHSMWRVAPVLAWIIVALSPASGRAQADRFAWLESPGSPRVRDWLQRLWARPGWQTAVEMAFAVG